MIPRATGEVAGAPRAFGQMVMEMDNNKKHAFECSLYEMACAQ
jgi:hypothetical protein